VPQPNLPKHIDDNLRLLPLLSEEMRGLMCKLDTLQEVGWPNTAPRFMPLLKMLWVCSSPFLQALMVCAAGSGTSSYWFRIASDAGGGWWGAAG
jgi:hypothetical protein